MESIFVKTSDNPILTESANFSASVQIGTETRRKNVDEFYTEKRFTLNDFGIEIPRFSTIFRQICGGNSEND